MRALRIRVLTDGTLFLRASAPALNAPAAELPMAGSKGCSPWITDRSSVTDAVGSSRSRAGLLSSALTAVLRVRRIYDLYTDFVLKNPFYEVEMPIRCELFDTNLFATIGMLHRRWGVVTG